MSSFAGAGNPILYAQFQSRGGWRRLALTVVGFVVLVAGLIAVSVYETRTSQREDTLSRSLNVLLGMQVLVVSFFGTIRISSAVRADFKDGMIESHRLMPMPRMTAVIGYLVGAATQPIALGAATVLIGLVICPLTHAIDPARWLTANFMLACFTLMVWAISAQIAFSVRGGVLILVIVAFMLLGNLGSAFTLLPGFALITYPLVGHSLFALDTSFADVQSAYGISLVVQAAITAVCLAAAARKYRSRDGIGLNAPLGLVLLLIGVGASMMAICNQSLFSWGYRGGYEDARVQFAATVATTLLLALVPLSSGGRSSAARDLALRPPRLVMVTVALTAIGIASLLLLVAPRIQPAVWRPAAEADTFVVIAVAVVSFAALFRWAYSVANKAWWIAAIWLAVVWFCPLAAQWVHEAGATPHSPEVWYSTASPVGALSAIWNHDPSFARIGIYIQAAMTVIPLGLAGVAAWKPQQRAGRFSVSS